MKDIEKAIDLLSENEYTCVLCKDEKNCTSSLRGVKPLVQWIESNIDFTGYCAADKVVGKATAFLYVLMKVKAVYARVISKSALVVLEENNIEVQYGTIVDNIINRRGDGICPFEAAVLDIDDTDAAYRVIRNKMKELNITL